MTGAISLNDVRETLRSSRVLGLHGPNFSGRTTILRQLTGLDAGGNELGVDARANGVYIGPEIYNSLSSVAATVRDELHIHGELSCHAADRLLQMSGVAQLGGRNPFTLSGGEQVALAIASGLRARPEILAVDCATEQLAIDIRRQFLADIRSSDDLSSRVLLADNRLDEYAGGLAVFQLDARAARHDTKKLALIPDALRGLAPVDPCSVSLEAVSFHYPGAPDVLRGVSIDLLPGSVYTLHGKNGSGKSTLAKLLAGADIRPSSGKILCNSREYRPWRQPGQLVAYHFQNPDFQLFATTVEEELRLRIMARSSSCPSWFLTILRNIGQCLAFDHHRIIGPSHKAPGGAGPMLDAALLGFGLEGCRGQHPLELPFVLRKRTAMAATVAMNTPWIILDEPTLGQDDDTVNCLADIIDALCRRGTGVIVITHSPRFRDRLKGTNLILRDGRLFPL